MADEALETLGRLPSELALRHAALPVARRFESDARERPREAGEQVRQRLVLLLGEIVLHELLAVNEPRDELLAGGAGDHVAAALDAEARFGREQVPDQPRFVLRVPRLEQLRSRVRADVRDLDPDDESFRSFAWNARSRRSSVW